MTASPSAKTAESKVDYTADYAKNATAKCSPHFGQVKMSKRLTKRQAIKGLTVEVLEKIQREWEAAKTEEEAKEIESWTAEKFIFFDKDFKG